MTCPEIVLALLNDPTKVDNFRASALRAFIDARRMLRKNLDRQLAFMATMSKYNGDDRLNAPVHALLNSATEIAIIIQCIDGRIILSTPLGVKVDLCTPRDT